MLLSSSNLLSCGGDNSRPPEQGFCFDGSTAENLAEPLAGLVRRRSPGDDFLSSLDRRLRTDTEMRLCSTMLPRGSAAEGVPTSEWITKCSASFGSEITGALVVDVVVFMAPFER